MSGAPARLLRVVTLLATAWLAGCSTVSTGNIRMPLVDVATSAAPPNVTAEDRRPPERRVVHGGPTFSCERWYGDDSYVPDKVTHLRQLIGARMTGPVHLRIFIFDTIEFCENTQHQLTQNYWRTRRYSPGDGIAHEPTREEWGDRFELRIGGQLNGKVFAVVRMFVYRPVAKHGFVELPGTKPEYLAELRKTFELAADEIVRQVTAAAP